MTFVVVWVAVCELWAPFRGWLFDLPNGSEAIRKLDSNQQTNCSSGALA